MKLSLVLICIATTSTAASHLHLKQKLSKKLRASKNLILAKQAAAQNAECRGDEGCTCTEQNIVSATENCLLFTNSAKYHSGSIFGDGSCSYDVKVESVDCQVCPGQITRSKGQTCYEVQGWPEDTYMQYEVSHKSKKGCKQHISRSACKGPTPPPTPAPIGIDTYSGVWKLRGTNSNFKTGFTTTFSETDTQIQTKEYTHGWEGAVSTTFGRTPPGPTGGIDVKVTASYTATKNWKDTTSQTLTTMNSETNTIECSSTCEDGDAIYAWWVTGSSSKHSDYEVVVPAMCIFECIAPDAKQTEPVCPPTYCDPTKGKCACCWSLEWAGGDVPTKDLPPLCEEHEAMKAAITSGKAWNPTMP